jgi:hypothetical protein
MAGPIGLFKAIAVCLSSRSKSEVKVLALTPNSSETSRTTPLFFAGKRRVQRALRAVRVRIGFCSRNSLKSSAKKFVPSPLRAMSAKSRYRSRDNKLLHGADLYPTVGGNRPLWEVACMRLKFSMSICRGSSIWSIGFLQPFGRCTDEQRCHFQHNSQPAYRSSPKWHISAPSVG